MRIMIRVEASSDIGTGHVTRCVTLASEMRSKGMLVTFICRRRDGDMVQAISVAGYEVLVIGSVPNPFDALDKASWLGAPVEVDALETIQAIGSKSPDWLIIDNYGIGASWETKLRPFVKKIMVIDDLADRFHDCDLLLDQNYFENQGERYRALVPRECVCMLGPEFSLFRKEVLLSIASAPSYTYRKVKRVLVFMGGADPHRQTEKVMTALELITDLNISVNVVVGRVNARAEIIRRRCQSIQNCEYHQNPGNFAQMMQDADLAIGTGGVAALERCFVGLPSLVLLVADNQIETTAALHNQGAVFCMGWFERIPPVDIANLVRQLVNSPDTLIQLQTKGRQIFGQEGFGGADSVVRRLMSI